MTDTCMLYPENDRNCKEHLQSYTNCLMNSDSVYVSHLHQQEQAVKKISFLSLISPQCRSSLEPLICLFFIHICVDSHGMDIGPSKEQCRYTAKVCNNDLEKYKNFIDVDEYLSNCALESPFDGKNCIIMNNASIQNCSAGFYLMENGSCQPECNVWSPYSQTMVLITDILTIIPAVVCVLSGVAVVVFSWIRYQKL